MLCDMWPGLTPPRKLSSSCQPVGNTVLKREILSSARLLQQQPFRSLPASIQVYSFFNGHWTHRFAMKRVILYSAFQPLVVNNYINGQQSYHLDMKRAVLYSGSQPKSITTQFIHWKQYVVPKHVILSSAFQPLLVNNYVNIQLFR